MSLAVLPERGRSALEARRLFDGYKYLYLTRGDFFMIRHTCPHCDQLVLSLDDLAGLTRACPGCKQSLTVPAVSESTVLDAEPQVQHALAGADLAVDRFIGDTFVGKQIRRCNRNLLLLYLFLLAVILAVPLCFQRYFYNFFQGPLAIDRQSLVALQDPDALFQYYVTVQGDESLGTVLKDEKMKGERKEVVGRYLALKMGKRLLLVHTFPDDPGTEFTGTLERVPGHVFDSLELQKALRNVNLGLRFKEVEDPPQLERANYLPVMLDVGNFHAAGYVYLAVAAVALILLLGFSAQLVFRWTHPETHPSARALSKYGSPAQVASAIDSEVANQESQSAAIRCYDLIGYTGTVLVTPSWLLRKKFFGLDVVRLADVVSVQSVLDQHQIAQVVPTDKEYSVSIQDRDGGVLVVDFKKRKEAAEALIAAIRRRQSEAGTVGTRRQSAGSLDDRNPALPATFGEEARPFSALVAQPSPVEDQGNAGARSGELAGAIVAAFLGAVALAAPALYFQADRTFTGLLAVLGMLVGFMGGRFAGSIIGPGESIFSAAGKAGSIASTAGCFIGGYLTMREGFLAILIGVLAGGVLLGLLGAFFGAVVAGVRKWSNK